MWLENKSFAGESRGQVRYIFRSKYAHKSKTKGKEKYYYITLTKCRFVNIFSREDICDIIPVVPVEQWDWQRSRVISGGRLSLTSPSLPLPPLSLWRWQCCLSQVCERDNIHLQLFARTLFYENISRSLSSTWGIFCTSSHFEMLSSLYFGLVWTWHFHTLSFPLP